MAKIVYIIPGFMQNTTIGGYKEVIKFFKARNFKTVPIKITWKHRVMSDYVQEFLDQLRHTRKDEAYFFGFSFGAMIAFISAVMIKPKTIFLCSLSPYFKEDLRFIKKSWKKFVGKRRMDNLKDLSFDRLAKNLECKTILVVGDQESENVRRRVDDAHKRIKSSKLVIAKGAKHNISQKEYVETLKKVISES